jgi:nucleotide-binding universal stress UspA family protein
MRVLLALSTFRTSDAACVRALELAAGGSLDLIYVVDVNVQRYLYGSGVGMLPAFASEVREALLAQHRELGEKRIAELEREATAAGIPFASELEIGRFAPVVLAAAARLEPERIVTTRSGRPDWVLKLFGAPAVTVQAEAGCPVEIV